MVVLLFADARLSRLVRDVRAKVCARLCSADGQRFVDCYGSEADARQPMLAIAAAAERRR
jgi:hypothetical protein